MKNSNGEELQTNHSSSLFRNIQFNGNRFDKIISGQEMFEVVNIEQNLNTNKRTQNECGQKVEIEQNGATLDTCIRLRGHARFHKQWK